MKNLSSLRPHRSILMEFPSNRLFCWAFVQIVGGEIYTSEDKWYARINSDLYTEDGPVFTSDVQLAYQIRLESYQKQLEQELEDQAKSEEIQQGGLIQDYYDLCEDLFDQYEQEKREAIYHDVSRKYSFGPSKQIHDNEFLTVTPEKKPILLIIYSEHDIPVSPDQFISECQNLEKKKILPSITQINKILYRQTEEFIYLAYEKPNSLMNLSSMNLPKLSSKARVLVEDALARFEETLHQNKKTLFVVGDRDYVPNKDSLFYHRTEKTVYLKFPFLNDLTSQGKTNLASAMMKS